MNCPYCGFRFRKFAVNAAAVPDLAPIICEFCAAVGLLEHGEARQVTAEELAAIQQSPAWRDFIEPARRIILDQINRRVQG